MNRNIGARLARLEHRQQLQQQQQRDDLDPIDILTIEIMDSIMNHTISDQMLARCLPALERIMGPRILDQEDEDP